MKLECPRQSYKNRQIPNFMKICPVGAELFHAERRTDGHDEANRSLFTILRMSLRTAPPFPFLIHDAMGEWLASYYVFGWPAFKIGAGDRFASLRLFMGFAMFPATAKIVSRPTLKRVRASSFHIPPVPAINAAWTCGVEVAVSNYHESLVSLIHTSEAYTQSHRPKPRIKMSQRKLVSRS
jgi:hypothetical protein